MERIVKGITFELPVENEAMDEYVRELAEKYEENVSRIVECILSDTSVAGMLQGVTRDDLVKRLGTPVMRPWKGADGCEISYLEWNEDEAHVLSVECIGVYEDFAYGPTVGD